MQPYEDNVIWDSFRQGNKQALSILFKRHHAALFRYGYKLCADRELVNDSLQELFIEIWEQKKPAPVISIKAYLLKSLRYKIHRILKTAANKWGERNMGELFEMSHESLMIKREEDNSRVRELLCELEKLSPRQREIIYLRFYLCIGYQEICSIMQIDYQVARNQLSLSIKKLKGILLPSSLRVVSRLNEHK